MQCLLNSRTIGEEIREKYSNGWSLGSTLQWVPELALQGL
jgi:hypothetical protein